MNVKKIKELQAENESLKRELLKYKAKEALSQRIFEFVLCTRKNGTKFIKIVYYSNEAAGWVEIARINLSKNEWVQDNFTTEEVYEELRGLT